MESRVNYILVGLFVILLTTGMIAGVIWLSTDETRFHYNTYVVNMRETVSGLTEQSSVKYNGIDVGYLHKIIIDDENPALVHLRLKIQQGVPITEDTTATLRAQGLTGMAYVNLKTSKAGGQRLKAKRGEKYPEIPTRPSFMFQLDATIRTLSENMTDLSHNLNKMLNHNNQMAFEKSLANIQTITNALSKNANAIDESVKHLSKTLSNASTASDRLPQMSEDLQKTIQSMQGMAQNVMNAANEVDLTMQNSRAAIRTFSQQALPDTMIALNRLSNAAVKIDQLSQTLNENPSVIVRGKTPPPTRARRIRC